MPGDLLALAWLAVGTASARVPEPAAFVDQQQCAFCYTADLSCLAPSFHEIANGIGTRRMPRPCSRTS
jgi:cytochrome c551/c552